MLPARRTTFPFKGIAGRVEVNVTAFKDGDARYQIIDRAGRRRNDGILLADMRRALGGDEGTLPDPAVGEKHHISLKPWAEEDPQRTFILVTFKFIPSE